MKNRDVSLDLRAVELFFSTVAWRQKKVIQRLTLQLLETLKQGKYENHIQHRRFFNRHRIVRQNPRFYHEKGILLPSSVDETTGYRFYDADKIEKARVIRQLRQDGIFHRGHRRRAGRMWR